jgi:CrcB protein
MTEVWLRAALWLGLALAATLLSIRLRVATALSRLAHHAVLSISIDRGCLRHAVDVHTPLRRTVHQPATPGTGAQRDTRNVRVGRARACREGAMMTTLMPYLLVGVGGFIGANARFVVARIVGAMFETKFPLGTFVINVSGSFLLGILGTILALKVMPNSESMRLALGVGFLGAYTTFSTFEFETHALFDDGSWLTATTNMFASLFVGLLAVRAGIVIAKTWIAP